MRSRLWLSAAGALILAPGMLLQAQQEPVPLPGEPSSIPLPGEATQDGPPPMPGEGVPDGSEENAGRRGLPFEFSGYIEDTWNGEYRRSGSSGVFFNNTRLRLNFADRLHRRIDVGGTLIVTGNLGHTRAELFQYLPRELQSTLPPGSEAALQFELEDQVFFQEAFATFSWERFRLRVGRHKFYSGTGFAFNPIDLFNRKNPLDPTYEIDGLDAVMGSWQLPGESELQAVIRAGQDFDTADLQARFKTRAGSWDVAFQFTRQTRPRFDWEAATLFDPVAGTDAPANSFERRFVWRLAAAEFAGEIGGIAVRGEGGYVFADGPSDAGTLSRAGKSHERLLLGADYTLESQLYLIAEYMRLGQGRARGADITLNDRMAFLTGETLAISRDTLFSGVSYPITDLIDLSFYAITDLNGPSTMLNPWLTWNLRPGLKLSISGAVPVGSESTANGRLGPGGFIRLRYSF